MDKITFIRSQVDLPEKSVKSTIDLLAEGATLAFIARYRKDSTGNLDEVAIEKISNLSKVFDELEKRKQTVLKAIKDQGGLTGDLEKKIIQSVNMTELEDLYLPFKKKRKTKAEDARDAGLEGLAKILVQGSTDPKQAAKKFITGKVKNEEKALEGAKHIVAEWVSEKPQVRSGLRRLYARTAVITAKVIKAEIDKPESQRYKQYFEWNEPLKSIPSHRFLAIYRANNEGVLRMKTEIDKEAAIDIIEKHFLDPRSRSKYVLKEAIEDAYARLLKPSFNTEFIAEAKKKADEEAIRVFAENLEQLLLSPPLGDKRILAIDPGFKSGCKIVCINENGSLLHNENIYPHAPQKEIQLASKKIKTLINSYKIEAIAIGNGTASRETEIFIKKIPMDREVKVFMVNEAGASVYSASKIARDEFPEYDITVRGAVSIGRRLIDPLAELVKIDPKAIGVGQYQHEVDQSKLKDKLDTVVMSCVNRVGVNVNTASKELLSYVSGIGPALAQNVIDFREENGKIQSRKDLKKIPRLGEKAFEQAAGFLRIKNGRNPLDNSSVHPEQYSTVEDFARDLNLKVEELVGNKEVIKSLHLEKYISGMVGILTLKDIVKELEKPGSDPRQIRKAFEFDPSVKKIEDLRAGMKLPGIVNNITNFGCFVDLGIKESGLVHISKLAKGFVSDVNSVVKLNEEVMVTVLEVDESQRRIQLSLID